jgi:hypothetical protein
MQGDDIGRNVGDGWSISSFTRLIHLTYLRSYQSISIMKAASVLEVSLKVKVLGKHLDHGGVPHPIISHPLNHIRATRKVQGGVELHDDLIVPWIVESHNLIDLVVLTGCNDLVEQWVVLVPDVGPVDALQRNHQSLLGQDHGVVPIRIKMALEAGIPVSLVLLKVVLILGFGDQPMIRVGLIGV